MNIAPIEARKRSRWRWLAAALIVSSAACVIFWFVSQFRIHPSKFYNVSKTTWTLDWEIDRLTLFAPAVSLAQNRQGPFVLPKKYTSDEEYDLGLVRSGWLISSTITGSGGIQSSTVSAYHYWGISIPVTIRIGLLIGIFGVAVWWRFCRRSIQPGLCPNCGYDLRATPERCPECGTVTKPLTPKPS